MGARPALVLASASPRRLALLNQIGVTPDHVAAADLDESALSRELPRQTAMRLAAAKARHVAATYPAAVILAADTVVAVGRRALPKAEAEAEARACLALLSGRSHQVISAVYVIGPDGTARQRSVITRVTFKRLSGLEIARYLASGEWQGKAGGYAIQGLAASLITKISGSYSAVVGLPLYETAMMLDAAGVR